MACGIAMIGVGDEWMHTPGTRTISSNLLMLIEQLHGCFAKLPVVAAAAGWNLQPLNWVNWETVLLCTFNIIECHD